VKKPTTAHFVLSIVVGENTNYSTLSLLVVGENTNYGALCLEIVVVEIFNYGGIFFEVK
jgi:hypothetical protein